MESKLKRVKLSDLGRIVTGKTPSTKDQDNFGDKCFFITPRDIFGQRTVTFTERKLSETGKTKLRNYLIPAKSICVTCIGSDMGKVVMTTGESITNQQINSIIPNDTVVNPYYLYYCLKPMKEYLKSIAGGTTMPILNKSDFSDLVVDLPLLESQNKIVEILSSLDDKIELNNEMNKTLEEMAQIIFKAWFADFEPFKDGEFEETELGMIPKGWNIKSVYDYAKYINGTSFKNQEYAETGLPIIKIAELKDGIGEKTKYFNGEKDSKYYLKNNDILFSWSGNPDTSIDTFIWYKGDAILNQHIFRVIPNKASEYYFVYLMLKYLKPTFTNIARDKQTTGLGHVTVKDLKDLKFVYDENVVWKFSQYVKPLVDRMVGNYRNIEELKNIRDTLLPMLISCEIRLNNQSQS